MLKTTVTSIALILVAGAASACGAGWEKIEGSNACQRASAVAIDYGLQGEAREPEIRNSVNVYVDDADNPSVVYGVRETAWDIYREDGPFIGSNVIEGEPPKPDSFFNF